MTAAQSFGLENQVAFITGAASGIGYACALRYAQEGATIIGTDIQDCPEWEAVLNLAPKSRWLNVDTTDESALQNKLLPIAKELGRVDIVLTAAGVPGGLAVSDIPMDEWRRTIDINLTGTMLAIRTVLPMMIEARSGSIITIASVEGLEGSEGGSAYNASKGGVVLLTKNMAMDYGRLGIRANSICPGFIDTPMLRSVLDMEGMEEIKKGIIFQHKLKRLGRPEELAGVAYFLASKDSSFVTGHALPVDGGYVAGHMYGITEMMGYE
jgi:NAD(P)-dependent dehydrogenase (short-subunit alcohol dehydrogenase family)